MGRFAWTVVSAFVVESVVFGLAVLPAAVFWQWHFTWEIDAVWLRIVLLAMSFLPAYLLFAVMLMALSALAMRGLGWRTLPNAELRISDLSWELANWARYGVSSHIVRMFAGSVFRNTPVWIWYMRLNGARIGRRCWVNSLDVVEHCLLEFGDVEGGLHDTCRSGRVGHRKRVRGEWPDAQGQQRGNDECGAHRVLATADPTDRLDREGVNGEEQRG